MIVIVMIMIIIIIVVVEVVVVYKFNTITGCKVMCKVHKLKLFLWCLMKTVWVSRYNHRCTVVCTVCTVVFNFMILFKLKCTG